jgi:hypothetical protein
MAEATDRPADAVTEPPAAGAAEAPAEEAPRPYSAVSLLAVLGFAGAALTAGFLAVGGLIALFLHVPLLVPLWLFVVPAAAAVVCWAARGRIKGSEGALTGTRLTDWGIGLSLGAALLYAAYYAASYLAVSQQAVAFADSWFAHLTSPDDPGHLDKAFRLTLLQRLADDENLHDRIQAEHNNGGPGKGGAFTAFSQDPFVRQLTEGGAARFQCVGVQAWSYEADGYHVDLAYHIDAPTASYNVVVTVVGAESTTGDAGRQWVVVRKDLKDKEPQLTDEGQRLTQLALAGGQFLKGWTDKQAKDRFDEAYLDTLPAAERRRQARGREKLQAKDKAQREALAAADPECKAYADGLKAYEAGGLIRADDKTFWVPKGKTPDGKPVREDVVAKARALFAPDKWDPKLVLPTRSPIPIYTKDGAVERLAYDWQIVLMPDYYVEARFVLEHAPAAEGDDAWRLLGVDLIDAHGASLPAGARMPPGVIPPGG